MAAGDVAMCGQNENTQQLVLGLDITEACQDHGSQNAHTTVARGGGPEQQLAHVGTTTECVCLLQPVLGCSIGPGTCSGTHHSHLGGAGTTLRQNHSLPWWPCANPLVTYMLDMYACMAAMHVDAIALQHVITCNVNSQATYLPTQLDVRESKSVTE